MDERTHNPPSEGYQLVSRDEVVEVVVPSGIRIATNAPEDIMWGVYDGDGRAAMVIRTPETSPEGHPIRRSFYVIDAGFRARRATVCFTRGEAPNLCVDSKILKIQDVPRAHAFHPLVNLALPIPNAARAVHVAEGFFLYTKKPRTIPARGSLR